jgi:glutaminyl-tRNA synthetase
VHTKTSDATPATAVPDSAARDFLRAIVAEDVRAGRHDGRVATRFPPEPNGYLHIGHAKSIVLNFGIAREFGGQCHLRFDDTNPETEEQEYVDSIIDAVRWLGVDWGPHLYFGSDYFERMYEAGEHLIRTGRAYVDGASEEEIREKRGTVTEPGSPTRDRDRPAEESLDLFRRMRAGEFADGTYVLRARIDLASPNMLMRDPILYRIRHARHYRQGDDWCIYPLYDYAHPLEDAFECITHSICTLEFENNRELYDWVVENCPVPCQPRQYEFARLQLDYTVMSKRKLLELVKDGRVRGWDDPRMPTLVGLRRRGVTPEAIRNFCERIGVARTNSRVDIAKLEYAIRDDLNQRAPRVLCVLRPLRVVITNWNAGETEEIDAPYWPHDVPKQGSRIVPFGREIFIEQDDFMEDPPPGFFRLAPGREVRLRYAYVIRCKEVVKDAAGNVVELRCTYDPETKGGTAAGREVKGTLHWVSSAHALQCEVRLYDRLFSVTDPDAVSEESGQPLAELLHPDSLVTLTEARIEPSVANTLPETSYQFERLGYFISDRHDSLPGALVFNRTVTLRDTWARVSQAVTEDPGRPRRRPAHAAAPSPARPRRQAERTRSPDLEARYHRFTESYGLSAEDADILTREAAVADLFEKTMQSGAPARSAANWIINELPRETKERDLASLPFGGPELASLLARIEDGTLTTNAAREVLAELAAKGGDPARIIEKRGLEQVSDSSALTAIIDEVLQSNPDKVSAYRGGRTGLLGFFVGQIMARTGGRANPELARNLLESRLGSGA